MNLSDSFKKVFPSIWDINIVENGCFQISDSTIPSKEGYLIDVSRELNSLVAKVYFESYSKELQEIVLNSLKEKQESLNKFSSTFSSTMFITRKTVLEKNFNVDKSKIETIEFEIYFKTLDRPYPEEIFFEILFSFILLIFPYQIEGELEGESKSELSTKYERNRLNRSICLAYYGYDCKVCGIDMQKTYGDVAAKFIHVHHIKPVSELNNTIVDPIKDLVPLCPNCHSIAHLKNPPYLIDEIKLMLSKND